MKNMVTYMLRRMGLMRLRERAFRPAINPAEYDSFFSSPVWLAMRQQVAEQMDGVYYILSSSSSSDMQIRMAQSALHTLEWFLGLENELRERVTNKRDVLVKAEELESQLNTVLEILIPKPEQEKK